MINKQENEKQLLASENSFQTFFLNVKFPTREAALLHPLFKNEVANAKQYRAKIKNFV